MDHNMDVAPLSENYLVAPAEFRDMFDISIQAISKSIKKLEIPLVQKNKRNYLDSMGARRLLETRGYVYPNKIVSFAILKGGAGKSAISYNLAVRASQLGARVLCIDLDQQGNMTQGVLGKHSDSFQEERDGEIFDTFNTMIDVVEKNSKINIRDAVIKVTENLSIVPSNMNNSILDDYFGNHNIPLDKVFKRMLEPLRSDYDLIIFDCPPAINKPNIAAALASDEIIMPVNPDRYSYGGLRQTVKSIKEINENFGTDLNMRIIYNKFHERKNASKEYLGKLYADEEYRSMMFSTVIKDSTDISNCINQKTSIFIDGQASTGRSDLDAFAKEILEMDFSKEGTLQ
jgi:chromosome partitioning protein